MQTVDTVPNWPLTKENRNRWLTDRMTKTAPNRRRMTKAEQRAETMEQILDEAEYLFAQSGFNGVTLKDIAKRVGVHHTLLNYYFDD